MGSGSQARGDARDVLAHDDVSRHAFIVTAHEATPILERMVERLAPLGEVLIHVDARVPTAPFHKLLPSATIISDRVAVTYPDWSLVQASLNLARRAIESEGVERITLLRSTHYPIVDDEALGGLVDDQMDYIDARPAPDASRGKPVSRFTRRSVTSRRYGGWWHSVRAGTVNRVRPPLDWSVALGTRRLYAGSAYWSLRATTVAEVLNVVDAGGPLVAYFSSIDSADESLFHSIVPTVSDRVACRPISFSQWDAGQHPAPLTRLGLHAAMEEGSYFFAKKFDVALADWVDTEVRRESALAARHRLGARATTVD